ncbi:MAG: hypothetical protein ABI305_13760 [Tepidiformaceae bacterium]
MTTGRVLLALLLLGTLLASACGSGGGALATLTDCPAPSPLASPRRGSFTDGPYLAAVNSYVERLQQLHEDERAKYPDRTYNSSDEFRVDFASYSNDTICAATNLLSLQPASPGTKTYKTKLDAAVTALIDHTEAGRDAVKSRNVSDYRRWYDGVDAKVQDVATAARASITSNGR